MKDSTIDLETVGLTLAVGVAGGFAFYLVGLPLPWLAGPAVTVAGAALFGTRVGLSRPLRESAIIFLGATMGSTVTPETLSLIVRWPLTLTGLALAMLSIMVSGAFYLERVHGFDRATARLASVPGALNYVLALALESQSDPRRVAIVQMLRLGAILMLLPPLITFAGAHVPATAARAPVPIHLGEIALLLGAAAFGAYLFTRLKTPAPSLFGAMVAGAALYGSGLLSSPMPEWLILPGFVVLGAMIGSNFAGTEPRLLAATLGAGLGSLGVSALVALIWAAPAAWIVGLPAVQVWLAYAPGGVETTAITALALGLDAAFVSGHHVARVLMLNLFVPFWLGRDLKGGPKGNAPSG